MAFVQKCIPDAYHASIFDIPYDDLKKQGVKALFFDLDNTVIGYHQDELGQKEMQFIQKLAKKFKILILSNSSQKRVSHALRMTSFDYIWHAYKPTSIGFKKGLKIVGLRKGDVVMIGDQLMTDIYGAKRFGIKAFLVGSVKRSSDRKLTQMNRKIEAWVLKKIEKKYPKVYQERLYDYVQDHAL